MKTSIRAVFVFTSLHLVIFFLCTVTRGFESLIHSQDTTYVPSTLMRGFSYFYWLLSLPLVPSFYRSSVAIPTVPLFIYLANSFTWGISLATIQGIIEAKRPPHSQKPSVESAKETHVSFPLEVIFLFIILTLIWSALSLFDLGLTTADSQNIVVAYLKKLAVFPLVPLIVPEKTFGEMAFLGDLPVVLLNMVAWSIFLTLLLHSLRHFKKEKTSIK